MRHRFTLLGLVSLLSLIPLPAVGQDRLQEPASRLPRLALDDTGRDEALRVIGEAMSPAPVAVRIVLASPVADAELDRRLDALEARRIPVWLAISVPSAEGDVEPWRGALRLLADRRGSTLTVLELLIDTQAVRVATFAVQSAATELRSRGEDIRIALGGPAMADAARRGALYTPALAPYVDLVALPSASPSSEGIALRRIDPDVRVALVPAPGAPAVGRLVDAVVGDLGTDVAIHAWRASEVTPAALRTLAPLAAVLSHELTPLEPASVDLSLRVGTRDVSSSLSHRMLFDTDTFATLLVYRGEASTDPLAVSLRLPMEGTPGLLDLSTGQPLSTLSYSRDPMTFVAQATMPLVGSTVLVNFNEGADAIAERSGVTAARQLSVAEIISRHQRQQATQDRLVRSYIADARMRQFIRPTPTDPGYDVVTVHRYFVAGDGIEWEERSFSVNNRTWDDRPPFPLLQPEQVFSLPLQLRFDEGYTYRLAGTDTVDGIECYEVRFEPVRRDPTLYQGTVWIDRRTFARIRVQARKGGLSGTVVSNDETLRYSPVTTIGNQPIYLLSSVRGHQLVLIGGTNIPVDKEVTFSGFRVNDDEFDGDRNAVRASEAVMFKETAGGLRYYIKRDGARVVSDRMTDSVKAMAIGTVVDPSYQFPLPIFGINYIDFNFGNPDTQLAMLFAGVLAAGNIQRPQLGSTKLDGSLDFFAIAAPSSDRIFAAGGEAESERVLTWPMSTGLNLGWQATAFQKLSLGYELRFDAYVRDTTTAETFRVPSSTLTNGIGGTWEYSRAGYNVALNGTWYTRGRWREWGAEGALQQTSRSYTKLSASVSREFFIDAFQKVNVNGAWFGGQDLDRFVKYQFGLFDSTRIHGVPAVVRFAELAMARGSYSVNVFDQYRLDLFLDHAWGQEQDGDAWQRVPGVGAAFNLPGPWNTIVRADVGKSWLPDRYGSLGSTVLQVMLLKPLR
jgi:hypothetical protein